jgi:aminoglycoside 6'-N-acetyltransferase I
VLEIVPFEAISMTQRAAAASLLTRAFDHQPSSWRTLAEASREVDSFFDDPERSALAALEGARLVGWVGLVRTYARAFELHPIAVDPARQRQGFGAKLVSAVERLARSEGALTLYLGSDDDFGGTTLFGADAFPDVLKSLAGAAPTARGHPMGFYLKLGFALCGLVPDANGPGMPDILMAKRL